MDDVCPPELLAQAFATSRSAAPVLNGAPSLVWQLREIVRTHPEQMWCVYLQSALTYIEELESR